MFKLTFFLSQLKHTQSIVALFVALLSYMSSIHGAVFLSDLDWSCGIGTAFLWCTGMCSTYFILSMTFDRFYSIIRPHKAASFNTIKRTKITIASIISLSIMYNIPSLFIARIEGRECVPEMDFWLKTLYYWLSYVVQFVFPFVMLLTMNCTIIHTLRTRTILHQGQNWKSRSRSLTRSSE